MKSPSVPHLKVVDASKPFAAHAVRIRRPCKGTEYRVFTRPDTNSIERKKVLKWAMLTVLIAAIACAASWYCQRGPIPTFKPRSERLVLGVGTLAKSDGLKESIVRVAPGRTSVNPQGPEVCQRTVLSLTVRKQQETKCARPDFVAEQGTMSFARYQLDVAFNPRPGELDDFTIRAMKTANDLTSLCHDIGRELIHGVLTGTITLSHRKLLDKTVTRNCGGN
jgi:hypothetical protein